MLLTKYKGFGFVTVTLKLEAESRIGKSLVGRACRALESLVKKLDRTSPGLAKLAVVGFPLPAPVRPALCQDQPRHFNCIPAYRLSHSFRLLHLRQAQSRSLHRPVTHGLLHVYDLRRTVLALLKRAPSLRGYWLPLQTALRSI